MDIVFAGCGSAFTSPDYYQTMAIVEKNSRRLLIDCGSDARFALPEAFARSPIPSKVPTYLDTIDGVYISHLHADHIGGLEWLAFMTYFSPKVDWSIPGAELFHKDVPFNWRPKLWANEDLMRRLWECSLRGGLESIEGKQMTLTDYFDCVPLKANEEFTWEGINLQPVQTVHVMSGYSIVHSYGLMMTAPRKYADDPPHPTIFYTGDTQFCPNQIQHFYDKADVIFQDCETAPFKSRVHAHYSDLLTLSEETREKMWLMHYQPNPKQDAEADGFSGFVQKGQVFGYGEM